MTQQQKFVHLQPATMDPCSLSGEAYDEARNTWLCTGCCAPRPEVQKIDVQVEKNCLEGKALTFVNGCGVALAHRSLLDSVPATAVRQDLCLGKVCDSEGGILDEWQTFRGRHRLIVRGSRNGSYRQCTDCGRHVYFAMGRRYLYPAPDKGVILFESDLSGLILPASYFEQLSRNSWPFVTIESLLISNPRDSLGLLT